MENKNKNDLFFVCSLIENVSRCTKNKKEYVVKCLGEEKIKKIYELADVYHSENLDKVTEEIIKECNIKEGNYILKTKNNKPTIWEIGRVYQNFILKVNSDEKYYIDTLINVLSSWIIEKIDNYESSLYYENTDYIYECFKENKII